MPRKYGLLGASAESQKLRRPGMSPRIVRVDGLISRSFWFGRSVSDPDPVNVTQEC
ncbi:hypothetical protein ACFL5O_11710 [Myxococcota bacterium]